MSISLDNLAKVLIKWCRESTTELSKSGLYNEQELIDDFACYLNKNTKIKAMKGFSAYHTLDKADLVLYYNYEKVSEGVIAEFVIDNDRHSSDFKQEVLDASNRLKQKKLKYIYQLTTKCIVSLYSNMKNRNVMRNIEFIEVFNDVGIGCAIKRLS